MASASTPPVDEAAEPQQYKNNDSIEERCFMAALVSLEGHYTDSPSMGPLTSAKVTTMISRTLEKTHTSKEVREKLSRNVAIWIWLCRIVAAAVPSLTARSVGPLSSLNDPDKGVTPTESTNLIVKNWASLKEDLSMLSKLLHIARNLLVTPEPEVPQDLCAAVHFDQMVYQVIILCVNVTSKGYDGEILDNGSRTRLNEITDGYKKVLVTSLQHAHNWTAKNDRNKMSFWLDVLFDEESGLDDPSAYPVMLEFRPGVAKIQIQHWLERNSRMCEKAEALLRDYVKTRAHRPPGPLAPISPLAWNWLPKDSGESPADDPKDDTKITPNWDENEPNRFKQDAQYGRVSREIDTWWLSARDPNYEKWEVPMPSVEFAQTRTEHCKNNLIRRSNHAYRGDDHDDVQSGGAQVDESVTDEADAEAAEPQEQQEEDEYDDPVIEEEEDDDESYGEGPMTGLLTEVPNILDPKQIEALHLIVKSCILDTAGVGLTRAGENLQKTRCRMFLAADCGKSLLREMLVFIAVWEQPETSLIFQITTQIIEAIHHSALLPYTWDSLRIPKDIISPAQTVLLRLINHMFQARKGKVAGTGPDKEQMRDVKLVYFLFASFRSRIVPECVALMHLQGLIRQGLVDPADFPVDNWDMERAKDGLAQFLDFLMTAVEMPEVRKYLVEWEVAYELITLLKALEAGVEKKPLVDLPNRSANRPNPPSPSSSLNELAHENWDISHAAYPGEPPAPPPPPPLQEPAHQFPWTQMKGEILTILAGLLQPPPNQCGPGNAEVQRQIVAHNGITAMLNCCVYDDYNPYARERVQICLKWLMDGSAAANNFVRDLVAVSRPPQFDGPPSARPPLPADAAPRNAPMATTPTPIPAPPSSTSFTPASFASLLPPGTHLPAPQGLTATSIDLTALPGTTTSLRIDGIGGEVKVQVRPNPKASSSSSSTAVNNNNNPPSSSSSSSSSTANPPPPSAPGGINLSNLLAAGLGAGINGSVLGAGIARLAAAGLISSDGQGGDGGNASSLLAAATGAAAPALQNGSKEARTRSEELLRDIVALADEAARLAMGQHTHAQHGAAGGVGGGGGGGRGEEGVGVEKDGDETEEEDFM